MAWNLVIVIFVAASAVIVPISVGFNNGLLQETRDGLATLDVVFDAFFIFDIVLNFRIGKLHSLKDV